MVTMKSEERAVAIEMNWRAVENPQLAVINDLFAPIAYQFSKKLNAEERTDMMVFISRYREGVSREQYDEVAFMYACFNLLYEGEEL